ncbi:MAG: serine/threonine protein kinase [Anaerolineaceae bacterium]|nr:serine/threonine protein kinase [Anaerolineaceae bacterium]
MASKDSIIGRKLGDYSIVDVLGHGGMARVYRGYDAKLDRYAAVKVIDSTLMVGQDPEEYRARFLKEARAIARLRHPNIVGIYQFDQSDTLYYMAMSFIEGKDLRHVLKNFSRSQTLMPHGQVLAIAQDMAAALDYAHRQDVIHRDVKPSNIMVTPDGEAVLTDFGLALNRSEGTIGNTFGSAYYIAPEQALSSAQSVPQSDLYSLGVVLYEMLAGQMPFNEPSPMNVALKHLNELPPPPSSFNPALSPEIDAVLLKVLEKDPTQRYASGKLLADALKQALGIQDNDDTYRLNVMWLPSWEERQKSASPAAASGPDAGEMTPQFGTYPDDTPTITDSESSAGWRANMMGGRIRRVPGWTPVAVLLVLLLASGMALLPGLLNSSEPPTPTAPPVASATAGSLALLPATMTVTPSPLPTTAPSLTAIPPSATAATGQSAAFTMQPTTPVPPTDPPDEPASTATISPTATPVASVLLRYDTDTLILWNRSEHDVDVSRLTFIQAVDEGDDIEFVSRMWAGGTRSTSALSPGDCFQVWRMDYAFLEQPAYCGTRHAWSQVAFPRWFWISDNPDTTFEVQRGGIVLAVCRVGDGECALNLP